MTWTYGDLDVNFDDFFDRFGTTDVDLLVVNREQPRPLLRMLEQTFADTAVSVDDVEFPEADTDVVLLVRDDEVVASSPLRELEESILLVNSDLYITGASGFDSSLLPDVLAELTDFPLRVRGYPESNKEKLPLIAVSRHIERHAHRSNGGTLRAAFQQLSRIEDEIGTRSVYERLADGETAVHVYGVPDWTPPVGLDLSIHGSYREVFRHTWFVVYWPDDVDARPAALLARHRGPNEWEGFWTYDEATVRDLNRHIERTM